MIVKLGSLHVNSQFCTFLLCFPLFSPTLWSLTLLNPEYRRKWRFIWWKIRKLRFRFRFRLAKMDASLSNQAPRRINKKKHSIEKNIDKNTLCTTLRRSPKTIHQLTNPDWCLPVCLPAHTYVCKSIYICACASGDGLWGGGSTLQSYKNNWFFTLALWSGLKWGTEIEN